MIKHLIKIDPLSCGKVLAVVYFGIALLFIPFFLLMMFLAPQMPSPTGGPSPGQMMGGLGLVFVILLPIIYGVLGFIGGLLVALIYNLAAKFTGGLAMTFTDVPSSLPPAYTPPLPPR